MPDGVPDVDLTGFEERLSVAFKNRSILRQALIHKSLTNDLGMSGLESNERLEFLGDAVLEVVVSEQLFRRFPDRDEGQLTLLRSALVRASSLAEWARELSLGEYVLIGRGEQRAGGRDRDALLSSAFEAVLGAVFVDRGFRVARSLVHRFVGPAVDRLGDRAVIDAKSRLQQVSQARFGVTPTYEVLGVTGEGHSPTFTVLVRAGGDVTATAEGKTKQGAQQTAAAEALTTIEGLETIEVLPGPMEADSSDDTAPAEGADAANGVATPDDGESARAAGRAVGRPAPGSEGLDGDQSSSERTGLPATSPDTEVPAP
ncbi:MAG: ribonuclease III [Chloroflexi bacterium]|nr:ribonuclease III [Chloroflexota bacterium]